MTDAEVIRYVNAVHLRMHILLHSGIDWKPGGGSMTDKEVEARFHNLGERSRALDALDPECKIVYEEIITLIPRVQEAVGRWLDDLD